MPPQDRFSRAAELFVSATNSSSASPAADGSSLMHALAACLSSPPLLFVGTSRAALAARYTAGVLNANDLSSGAVLPACDELELAAVIRQTTARRRPLGPRPVTCVHLPCELPKETLGSAVAELQPSAVLLDASALAHFALPAEPAPALVFAEGNTTAEQLEAWAGSGLRWFGSDREATGDRPIHWLGAAGTTSADTAQFDLFAAGVACGRFAVSWGAHHGIKAAAAALGLLAESRLVPLGQAGPALAALEAPAAK